MTPSGRFVSVTHHGSHPKLADRKQLLATLLIVRNLQLRAERDKVKSSSEIEDIKTNALAEITSIKVNRNGQSLKQYLATVAKRVNAACKTLRVTDPQQQALIESLIQEMRHARCKHCLAKAGDEAFCNDMAADYNAPDVHMECLHFITQLFESLVRVVDAYYAPLLPQQPHKLTLELKTVVAAKGTIGASTKHEDASGNRLTRVSVTLPVESFNAEHLTHLPYVLFHELFVHAAEGFSAPTREQTLDTCAFREGYLDAAAAYLLRDICEENPDHLPDFHSEFASELAAATISAHERRKCPADSNANPGTSADRQLRLVHDARKRGSKVHRKVSKAIGEDGARQIGIGLNVLALDHDERAKLIEMLEVMADTYSSQREDLARLRDATRPDYPESIDSRMEIVRRYIGDGPF